MSEVEAGRSLTDQVVDKIRDGITTGRFELDAHHSVQTFSKALGVSRTPVREALVRLADIGMVRFEKNRGITIIRPTVHKLEEIFELRLIVEPFGAGRAATRTDLQLINQLRKELDGMKTAVEANDIARFVEHDVGFHELIMKAAGNEKLAEIVHGLRDATRTVFAALLRDATSGQGKELGLRQSLADVMKDHEPVLAALERADQRLAAAAMYEHIERTGGLMLEQLAEATHGENFNPDWSKGIGVPAY